MSRNEETSCAEEGSKAVGWKGLLGVEDEDDDGSWEEEPDGGDDDDF